MDRTTATATAKFQPHIAVLFTTTIASVTNTSRLRLVRLENNKIIQQKLLVDQS